LPEGSVNETLDALFPLIGGCGGGGGWAKGGGGGLAAWLCVKGTEVW
jgi:hypothetical protein